MSFSVDPVATALLLLASLLHLRAVRELRGRGQRVSLGQQFAWHAGVAVSAIGLLSPIDGYAEDLLGAHMAQHLLIADIAAPLLLIGLRTPVHAFILPRPVLVPLARLGGLRRAARFARRPLVAIPVYVGVLYGWHLPFAFEGALRNDVLHVLQHESFVVASILVWWAPLEPERRRLRGELWKAGHVIGARAAGMFLGMAFLVTRSPVYAGFYGDRAREHGLSPLTDQQLAGGMMLSLDLIVMLFALGFFLWRAADDDERARRTGESEDDAAGRTAPAAR